MANLAQGWINLLRRQAKNDGPAPVADEPKQLPSSPSNDSLPIPQRPTPAGETVHEDVSPARRRLKSPTTSVNADRTRSPSPFRRSKSRPNPPADESTTDFPARPLARTKGRIWNEGDPIPTRESASAQPASQQHPRPSRRRDNRQAWNQTAEEEEDPSVNKMIGQPETRPISQEQLVAEVKGIYAGLVMVESKCIEVDSSQSAQNESRPNWPSSSSPPSPWTAAASLTHDYDVEWDGALSKQKLRGRKGPMPLSEDTESTINNEQWQASQRRFLSLSVNGAAAYAVPDTGLTGNAITEDYALSIGASIKRSSLKQRCINAKNVAFQSVGTTELIVSVPGKKWTCVFDVFKQLAAPLVLGRQFLHMTKAFTDLAHFMVRKTMSVLNNKSATLKTLWRFMHMEFPTQKLGCSLDAEQAFAALDTGSDIDVVSLDYAESRDWKIRPLPEGEGYILLANNELVRLTGYVETTLGIQGGYTSKRLYVLDGLLCDVLLGDPTIEALDIFTQFKSSIVDTMAADDDNDFRMIQMVKEIVKEIVQIEHKVEKLLADGPNDQASGTEVASWKSFFRKRGLGKGGPAETQRTIRELNKKLEDIEVRFANWRRAAETELSTLSGDEYVRKKAEFEKRKEENEQERVKIRLHLNAKLQNATTAAGRGIEST